MYLDGTWHTLALGAGARDASPTRSRARRQRACRTRLLAPVLRIGDVRTDKRIDFVGGARGTAELERLVELGQGRRRVLAVSR